MAIEKNAKDVVNTLFANELKNGTVVFKTVDISTPEGRENCRQVRSNMVFSFVNKWKGGKESRNNLTEFGFGNARNNPDGFRKGLADKIRQSLK